MTTRRIHRGFTLINLLMTIAIMAIVASVVVPSAANGVQLGVSSASMILASDLEYAQSLSLASPDDPVVVRFDPANGRYWLALQSDPAAPLVRPGSSRPYLVQFGVGESEASADVTMTLVNVPGNTLTFDKFGRLTTLNDASVTLAGSGPDRTVEVDATTGFVRIR